MTENESDSQQEPANPGDPAPTPPSPPRPRSNYMRSEKYKIGKKDPAKEKQA
jgi:hypothetical protein